MKYKAKKIPTFLILLLVIISIVGIWYNSFNSRRSERNYHPKAVEVIIREGMNAEGVGKVLEEKGIITSSREFVFFAKVMGDEKRIKAGRYTLSENMKTPEVLKKLVKGEISGLAVTIPEGLTINETADILATRLRINKGKFVRLANDEKFAARLGIPGKTTEGFLYPDTYEFNYDVTEEEIIKRLVNRFWKVFNDSLKKRAKEIGFSVYEVVTLASMIEKEAMLGNEKPIISQVYHKRLKLGRALECDATVQYILPKHKARLLYKDLKVKSPYNTYLHKGLPPGPIASPGKSSIIAVLYPAVKLMPTAVIFLDNVQ
ncbi:MAG: hypothetical protein B5M53_02175 [Candidatus Cloacimonas sp. 4484_209]|nr:MAG: hypothetical protein B5M53_02175 [Candidatus Cloacimonas sp. 4484_209]